ncbi:FabA/FabZ family ACP-dehydratase [Arenibacter sp. GZD96]|uniref:3-hydroxyacyl-ACP dehydratase FabZ family protein n=1 Tax=Aurantibrevibacter litoralis TaxID=3106030 RepID=UPI002AFDE65B|nr:FabA/FabZ family ACP-dehydratase [Arenibacter sp. GZD-96]MEA1786392.1 FabA/FabZ family ACP-dehydratase [Arenibacter sp. GZD-96]
MYKNILTQLPYAPPFLFVDRLLHIDEHGAEGSFTFRDDLDFYRGHFTHQPVTPGVILTECCAQIGLVCFGLYLSNKTNTLSNFSQPQVALSSAEMEFLKPVYPSETVTVKSTLMYFRFQKLKCAVRMNNEKDELVCRGALAGMIIPNSHGA